MTQFKGLGKDYGLIFSTGKSLGGYLQPDDTEIVNGRIMATVDGKKTAVIKENIAPRDLFFHNNRLHLALGRSIVDQSLREVGKYGNIARVFMRDDEPFVALANGRVLDLAGKERMDFGQYGSLQDIAFAASKYFIRADDGSTYLDMDNVEMHVGPMLYEHNPAKGSSEQIFEGYCRLSATDYALFFTGIAHSWTLDGSSFQGALLEYLPNRSEPRLWPVIRSSRLDTLGALHAVEECGDSGYHKDTALYLASRDCYKGRWTNGIWIISLNDTLNCRKLVTAEPVNHITSAPLILVNRLIDEASAAD